jgi:endonuclease YncB( thermonuclease family)
MGELVHFRRPSRRRRTALPAPSARHRPGPSFSAARIGLALSGGVLLGLMIFLAIRFWPAHPVPEAPPPPPAAFNDPWAESRRSRAILEAQEGAPPPVTRPGGSAPVRVPGVGHVRVIDGDTFVHDGEKIRIADIDTPEARGRCPHETALAAKATSRLHALLASGPFELHPLPGGRDRDRYGRQLRIVTRGGRSIGDVLVAEGLARTWSGRREGWCR